MEEKEYDIVVCGTGLTECVLAGLFSAHGKKVLHVDRNSYYGGDTASVNLTNLWNKFRPGQKPPEKYGANRDWNVDLIPKFILAAGKLVKIIIHTGIVANNLDWRTVEGTYVMQVSQGGMFSKGGKVSIHKVPANDKEALKSSLMGLWEKKRCKNFFQFVDNYEPGNPATHQGLNLQTGSFAEVIKKFSLEPNTVDFIGHAVALHTNDQFIYEPAHPTLMKIKLYMDSMYRYGESPFIYPIYGIGGIPEGFSRLSAIYGGTYILNKPVDGFSFNAQGQVIGVRSGDELAKTKMVLCDPSYAPHKVQVVGQIVRAICIMDHPIPNTDNAQACQVIIPQRQTGRQNDIFISMLGNQNQVCGPGYFITIISTQIETANPEAELEPAFAICGNVLEKFISISDMCVPVDDGLNDNVFVSKTFDATSHFESACDDIISLYQRIMKEIFNYDEPLKPFTTGETQEENQEQQQQEQQQEQPNPESQQQGQQE